jgi:hypothetical protein
MPHSSVPANILAALPALTDAIQHRLVGGNLIRSTFARA